MKTIIRAASLVLSTVIALGGLSLCASAEGRKHPDPGIMGEVAAISGYEVTITVGGGGPGGDRRRPPEDSTDMDASNEERLEPRANDGSVREQKMMMVDMSGVTIVSGGRNNQITASFSDITVGSRLRLTMENDAVTQVEIMQEMHPGTNGTTEKR